MYINAYLFTISGEISIAGKKKRGGAEVLPCPAGPPQTGVRPGGACGVFLYVFHPEFPRVFYQVFPQAFHQVFLRCVRD